MKHEKGNEMKHANVSHFVLGHCVYLYMHLIHAEIF